MDAATAMVLLLFLSAGVERFVEALMVVLDGLLDDGEAWRPGVRKGAAIVLSLFTGLAVAWPLDVDLISPVVGLQLPPATVTTATVFALAGGAGPVHELVRWLEEAKRAKGATAAALRRIPELPASSELRR